VRAIRLSLLTLLLAGACGSAALPPSSPALSSLLAEKKFEPNTCYTGADTPEDRPALERAVNDAIRDIAAMPAPVDGRAVRGRLEQLVGDVDSFATEDRDAAYRYAIRIWRAAGLQGETHLFARSDARVLGSPC
jgi:hypothetical protein